jgi:hypothetical protein
MANYARIYPPLPFTLAVVPDAQTMVATYPLVWASLCDWIIANTAPYQILATLTTGDNVDDPTQATQWTTLTGGTSRIEAVMPFVPIMGNHDYRGTFTLRNATEFDARFGPDHFAGAPWYGGRYADTTHANYYVTLARSGVRILVLALECFPRAAVVTWAAGIIDAYPTHRVVVATHSYLTDLGGLTDDSSDYGITYYGFPTADYNGAELWAVLKTKPNVDVVICGHDLYPYHAYLAGTADDGHTVGQIFHNWQGATNGGPLVGLLTFNPQQQQVSWSVYQTYAPDGLGFHADAAQTFDWSP